VWFPLRIMLRTRPYVEHVSLPSVRKYLRWHEVEVGVSDALSCYFVCLI
jgi:hypothetical protein